MSEALSLRDPVRPLTQAMMAWASYLEVVEKETYPLAGAVQQRTWDPDPRLVNLAGSLSAKSTDKVCYYEQLAILTHGKDGLWFVVFRETRDALLAQQRDPNKYPLWLIDSHVKTTELKTFIALMKGPPRPGMKDHWEWLRPIEEAFPDADWMVDVLVYFLLTKGVVQQNMYGTKD
jgi:hypothetical protein